MTQRTGKLNGSKGTIGNNGSNESSAESQVVDFVQVREQRNEEKRRQTERVLFKNFVGAYGVVNSSKILPIELIDVSERGCSFQILPNPENPWPTNSEEIPIRLYFTNDTYLEIFVKIQNSNPAIENNLRYVRYGCSVNTELKSYPAYRAFVEFLKFYSEHSRKDKGDLSVLYL